MKQIGIIGSGTMKKHKWSKPLKKFIDGDSYCLNCGLRRERHGLLGVWYMNDKTGNYGFDYQPCDTANPFAESAGPEKEKEKFNLK